MPKKTAVLVICSDLKHFKSFKQTSLDETYYPIKRSRQTPSTLWIEYLDGETISCTAYYPSLDIHILRGGLFDEALQLVEIPDNMKQEIQAICRISEWHDLT